VLAGRADREPSITETANRILQLLHQLKHRQDGLTVVMITHDEAIRHGRSLLPECKRLARRFVFENVRHHNPQSDSRPNNSNRQRRR